MSNLKVVIRENIEQTIIRIVKKLSIFWELIPLKYSLMCNISETNLLLKLDSKSRISTFSQSNE